MYISDVPTDFLQGVRHGLDVRGCETHVTDEEMKVVATFCEAATDPSDCADTICHDRGVAERKEARRRSGSRFFLVSADHVVALHACTDREAECSPYRCQGMDNVLWSATMIGYGCSKAYRTPEAAIREMLADHACTNIRIREC